MIRDSLGVPLELEEYPSELVAYDWLGHPIMSDDGDDYICIDGEYVLDEADNIRCYLLEHAVIKNTYQLYEEVKNG